MIAKLLNEQIPHTLHLRFDGRSEELSLDALGLDARATDTQIKQALAAHFDRAFTDFARHAIVRNSTTIVVRPEAIYG